jgi:peptide/nickel transport system ATP-binding protein
MAGPSAPLLLVKDLRKHFPIGTGFPPWKPSAFVRAVDGISFEVLPGETLGVVGESGCGKSTMARLLIHLIEPDKGDIILDGLGIGAHDGISVRSMRSRVQMVFQDSYASLNPRMPIEESIAFGPMADGVPHKEAMARSIDLMAKVGLEPSMFLHRYPHELSGGQRQRVNIARALAMQPQLLILDEAVSALDKSVEAQVLNLLADLKAEFDLTYIFISHDLNVVRYISDRVLVMYLGEIVEYGPVQDVYLDPQHPYTQALLSAQPSMDPDRRRKQAPISGDPPNPINPPSGCRFHTRCPMAQDLCRHTAPALASPAGTDHLTACHLVTGAIQPQTGKSVSG